MSFEKLIRIPDDRIGALIGKAGNVKSSIEKSCYVSIDIDGDNGEVFIKSVGDVEKMQPFKAMEIVSAIGRGFSPENAMTLLEGENTLHVIDLREFGSKSPDQVDRIRGRIIGEQGKARKNMENLSNTSIAVYGRTVSIIGGPTQLKLAVDAIESLSSGSMHGHVYKRIESSRRQEKFARMQLWEDQNVF